MQKFMKQNIAVFSVSLLVLGVVLAGPALAMDKMAMHISGQWVRAVPPVSKTTAAFMTIVNKSGQDDALIGAEVEFAGKVEIHNVRKKDGMMEMFKVEEVAIPKGKTATLKPGSFHVMMMGLTSVPTKGETVKVTLVFRNAGKVTVEAEVREGGMGMENGKKMKMKH